MTVAPVPPQAVDRKHPEQWAPQLLLALVKGDSLSPQEKEWEDWAREDFRPWAYQDPSKSANWQHMIGAALLWVDPAFALDGDGPFPARTILDWWEGLLATQVGQLDTDEMFRYFGLSEPLSCIYEPFRWGSVLGVRLLAERFPKNPNSPKVLDLTTRFSEVLCCLLALGGAPWTDPGYKGRAGFWYDGPTFSPASERSEAPGLQNDRGPLFCLATGWPLKVSRRETWAVVLGRQVLKTSGFGEAPGFQAAVDLLNGGPVAPVLARLQGIRLWAPQHWIRWPEGLLVYKPSRQNLNTPCIFWSWSDSASQEMEIGWPWGEGRHRQDRQHGSCEIQDGKIVATVDQGTAEHDLLAAQPTWSVTGDQDGIRVDPRGGIPDVPPDVQG
jgi:hypothetical protein